MSMIDGLIGLIFVMGLLLGASQRTVRLIMSTAIAALAHFSVPVLYPEVGRFFSAMVMLPRSMGDALAFLLIIVAFMGIFEAIMRRSFQGTFLPKIGILDQIFGALIGLPWAVLVASAVLMPMLYLGTVPGDSWVITLIRSLFRPFALVVLRIIYPPGFSAILDSFVG
jgi:uncharacterized membrane protein required for colicin V production